MNKKWNLMNKIYLYIYINALFRYEWCSNFCRRWCYERCLYSAGRYKEALGSETDPIIVGGVGGNRWGFGSNRWWEGEVEPTWDSSEKHKCGNWKKVCRQHGGPDLDQNMRECSPHGRLLYSGSVSFSVST